MNSFLNHMDFKFRITAPYSIEYYFSFGNNYGARVFERKKSYGPSEKKFDITLLERKNNLSVKNGDRLVRDGRAEYFELRVLSIQIGTYLQLTEEEVLEKIEVFKNLEVAK